MSNSGKIKILLLALFSAPNLIVTMPSNGKGIIYAILPGLLLGLLGIPLIQIISAFAYKRQLDRPSWNDKLFKKNKALSRYQFMAFFFIVIGLCWIIKTAIDYHGLNENGIMVLFFGIGILSGTYLTAYLLRSKMEKTSRIFFSATFFFFQWSTIKKPMVIRLFVIGLSVLVTSVAACKKKNNIDQTCFPGEATVRQIVNKQATIKLTAMINPVYIVEDGTIDTRLIPCNLPEEFYQNDLRVTVSGEVKATAQPGPGPCCTENFVITKITR